MKTVDSLDMYKTAQAAIDSIDLLLEEIGSECMLGSELADSAATEAEKKTYMHQVELCSKQAKKINQARWDIIEALKTFEA